MENIDKNATEGTTTTEEKDTITFSKTELANLINQAVATHTKRLQKSLREEFASKDVEDTDDEKVSVPSKKKAPKKAVEDADEEDKVTFLERELEKMKAERRAEKLEAKTKEVYGEIESHLNGKVKSENLKTVLKVLKADGNVNIRSNGLATFKLGDEEYSVQDGLDAWLATEDAQAFTIPAPGYGKKLSNKPSYPYANKGSQITTTNNDMSGMSKEQIALAKMMENRTK